MYWRKGKFGAKCVLTWWNRRRDLKVDNDVICQTCSYFLFISRFGSSLNLCCLASQRKNGRAEFESSFEPGLFQRAVGQCVSYIYLVYVI